MLQQGFIVALLKMMQGRRPRAEVQTVVIYNDQDARGRWIPLRLEIGSWVTLQPTMSGPWARDARTHGGATNAGAWKAEICKFRWSFARIHGKEVLQLDSILVRHAYQR